MSFVSKDLTKDIVIKSSVLILTFIAHWQSLIWITNKAQHHLDALLVSFILLTLFFYLLCNVDYRKDASHFKSAIFLLIFSTLAGILNYATIILNQLDFLFLILGIYAFFGLSHNKKIDWKKNLNVALLSAIGIPFYLEFRSGLGFSLRLFTAFIVEKTLNLFGVFTISSQDIIIVENSIAHIDIPCSGLKSVWIGSGFFLACMMLLNQRVSFTILFKYLVFVFLLLSTNIFRVLVLTSLALVFKLNKFAELIHSTLGILGFCVSCIAAWVMLSRVTKNQTISNSAIAISKESRRLYFTLTTTLILILFAISICNRPKTILNKINAISLTKELNTFPVELNQYEKNSFESSQQTVASKWGFDFKGYIGSVLFVQSRDFNIFHSPELCIVGNGTSVDSMQTFKISNNKVKLISLNKGSSVGIYWLQHNNFTTDSFIDYFHRYLFLKEKEWVLVSIIVNLQNKNNTKLLNEIIELYYNSVSESMND